jgi:hypothetical protein
MPSSEPTVSDLFAMSKEDKEKLSKNLASAIGAEGGEASSWPAPVRQMVVEDVTRRFSELLDIRLAAIMASAWSRYAMLRKYADPKQHPPDESVIVPLAEHDIDSKHSPAIEVLMNNTPVTKLTFAVKLTLTVKGVALRVQNARIREIRPGEVTAKGKISYGTAVIAERKSRTLTLPGSIDLGEGFPIRPRSGVATS